MFKKLKQKIEEGGEGGLEKVSFSPVKLPGSIIRSKSPLNEEKVHSSSELPGTLSELTTQLGSLEKDEQSGEIPSHLSSASHMSYQAKLRERINGLEQECVTLKEQLIKLSSKHTSEQLRLERQVAELDQQRTELKIEVVELELGGKMQFQESEKKCEELKDQITKLEVMASESQSTWEAQMGQLKDVVEEKEKCIIEEENRYSALEKKMSHVESQLRAYEKSSENEVVDRLHHEVADVEQRVRSRNLEIQILERRLASQAKESEEQVEKLLNKQEEQDRAHRKALDLAKEEKLAKKQLLKELDSLQLKCTQLEKEREIVKTQLTFQTESQQTLTAEYKYLQSSCDKKIQDLDHLVEDKDKRIKELLHHLKHITGENAVFEPVPRPPGMARRTASIGVQTNCDKPEAHADCTTQETSLSCEDVEVVRQQQCRLEEELAEKVKIIKVQQQKIMDIKKELRLQVASDQNACGQLNHSPSPPPLEPSMTTPDVNFQYLKHVVIKFVCSREDEALQLIRAISTLLEFSPQEEQHVRQYLNYKMSWFGVIPPPLFPPMQS